MKVRVRDVMSTDVITIDPDMPLKEAAVVMSRDGFSGLPVMADDRLVGIITESDFVARLAGDADDGLMSLLFRRAQDVPSTTVGDAMSADVHTIGPEESVTTAARLMADRGVNRLPVVDSDRRLVGLVTRADVMAVFARPDDVIAAEVVSEGVGGLVDPDSVRVSVTDGVVRLEGRVETVTEKRLLEEFARGVAGVVSVDSELQASFDDTRLPPL